MRISNLHEFWFTSKDGLRIACKRWDSRGPARGVLQIAHGMGEHSGRYCELIDALLEASFTVYANDHRGHGRTAASPQNFGDFGEGGFALLVEDMVELTRIAAKKENPERPFILFGHIMGSFAAQQYNISRDFYEGGRHEMLNELNRGEVRTSLLAWLSAVPGNQSPHKEPL